MSITEIKAGGWSVNEKLTSAQITSVDQNVTNALDKRSGQTDTLSSTVTVDGYLEFSGAGNKITLDAGVVLEANASGAFITANASGAKIITSNNGVFEIGGANTVFPQFTTAKTRSIVFEPSEAYYTSGTGAPDGDAWFHHTHQGATSTATGAQMYIPIPLHDNATLDTIYMYYVINSSHIPATKLNMTVFRRTPSTGAVVALRNAASGMLEVDGSDAASYYGGGAAQIFTYTCDQNNIIDRSIYQYFLLIEEESGASSAFGNLISGMAANYTTIANMQFA